MASSPRSVKARAAAWRLAPARLAVTLFALLAFANASYLTQTHIHGTPITPGVSDHGPQVSNPASDKDKYPPADDPANCPICQEILHSGAYVAPALIAALPPTLVAMAILVRPDAPVRVAPVSHNWQGRGPPRAG